MILATTSLSSGKKRKFFESAGVRVLVVKTKKGKTSLKDLMKKLAKMNIAHILVEGGSGVLSSFLEEELIDRILFFMSQKIIGGADSPSPVMGNGIKRLAEAKGLRDTRITRFKEDFLVEGYLN